jgi:hypothetical protein
LPEQSNCGTDNAARRRDLAVRCSSRLDREQGVEGGGNRQIQTLGERLCAKAVLSIAANSSSNSIDEGVVSANLVALKEESRQGGLLQI